MGESEGADEPQVLYYYTWDEQGSYQRRLIAEGVGTGMQIATGDLTGNGRIDIAVNGKQGAFIIFNEGPAAD